MGDAEGGIGKPRQRLHRIEALRDQQGAAAEQGHAPGREQAGRVEERHVAQEDAVPADIVAEHEIDAAEKGVLLGQDHALGPAARARRVEQGGGLVPGAPGVPGRAAVHRVERGQAHRLDAEPGRDPGEIIIVEKQDRPGIGDEGGELGGHRAAS